MQMFGRMRVRDSQFQSTPDLVNRENKCRCRRIRDPASFNPLPI